MDILRFSGGNTYQDQGAKSGGDLGVSVEDLAYSMRQDLIFQQHPQQVCSVRVKAYVFVFSAVTLTVFFLFLFFTLSVVEKKQNKTNTNNN